MNIEKTKTLYVDFLSEYKYVDVIAVGNYERARACNVKNQNITKDIVAEYEEACSILMEKLSGSDKKNLGAYQSQFFRSVVSPILSWILAIENTVKKYEIETLKFGDVYNSEVIFTYEAEGEVNRQWMYKSNFFLPNIVTNYFRLRRPELKIISNENGVCAVYKNFYARNVAYLSSSHLIAFFRLALSLFKKNKKVRTTGKIGLLVRNRTQSQFAMHLLEFFKDEFYVMSYEQAGSLRSNSRYLDSTSTNYINLNKNLSVFDILQSLLNGVLSLLRKKNDVYLELLDGALKIPMKFALKDIAVRSLDFRLYAKSLSKTEAKRIISFDMFSPHAHHLAYKVDKRNLIQIQTTLATPKCETSFIAGAKFLCTDKVFYDGLLNQSPKYNTFLDLIENPKSLNLDQELSSSDDLKSVVYFGQPVESESEKSLLFRIDEITKEYGLKLAVKIHPRQTKSDYDFIKDVVVVADEFDFNKYDLAITRSSSIGYDCWIKNLPIVFIRETQLMRNLRASYLPSGYSGDLRSVEELEEIIENYLRFKEDFFYFRDNFFKKGDYEILKKIKRSFNYEG